MIRHSLAALIALTTLGSASLAQDWELDRAASSVGFSFTAFNRPVDGSFSEFDAEIHLDPADLSEALIVATVMTPTVSVPSDYQRSLEGNSGLAVATHPVARFVSDTITATDEGYEAAGTLTIRDVAVPAVLPFTLVITDGRAVADGSFTVDRSSFGIVADNVGETVTITLHIEADAD